MTAGRTNHTMFAAAPAVMQALAPKSSGVSSITNDELLKLAEPFGEFASGDAQGDKRIAYGRAVLALAESKSAAKPTEAEGEAYTQGYFDGLSAQPAQAPDRKVAEHAYVETAFDYAKAPIGSRDWCLFWDGFKAASDPKPAQVAAPEQTSAVPPGAIYVTDTGHAWDAKGNPEMANDPNVEMFVPFVPVAAPTQADRLRLVNARESVAAADAALKDTQ